MNFSEITPYVAAGNFLLTWGIGFYVHLVNKNKATTDRMERMEADFNTRLSALYERFDAAQALLAERLSRVEATLAVVPTHDDLGKLYRELNETTQQVSRLSGELSQMNDNLRMLLHHMSSNKTSR